MSNPILKRAVVIDEVLAPSTLISPDERREPVSLDGGDYLSTPETRWSATLRWFIDTLALAGAAMAGVYAGDWLDEQDLPSDRPAGKTGQTRESE